MLHGTEVEAARSFGPAMVAAPKLATDPQYAEGILATIGNTPLVKLSRYLDNDAVELFAKLEFGNPGGSAKDRPAVQMLRHALDNALIDNNTVVIESSSGNMGIGLAQACRYLQLRFVCVADPHAQPQNLAILRALGAEIVLVTQPVAGSFLAARLEKVRELLDEIPEAYWPNQYANPDNPKAYELGTIRELDEALQGQIDYLFVATSTTGTALGCRDYLRSRGRSTEVVAVDSTGSVLFGGQLAKRHIPGLGAGIEPILARGQRFDYVRRVSDIDCVVGCRRAAHYEALLVGGSAGGVLEAVRSMESVLTGKRCAAILHDSGTRYLETVFNDQWVKDVLQFDPAKLDERIHAAPDTFHEN